MRKFRHPVGTGLGAMRRAEGVHDKNVAQRGHAPRQRVVAGLLAFEETHVLQQHHAARFNLDAVDPVADQRHLYLQQIGQPVRDRLQRKLRVGLTLGGPAEMRHQHDGGVRFDGLPDGRQRGYDTRIARNAAVRQRHVQVFPDQHAPAGERNVFHVDDVHVESSRPRSATQTPRARSPAPAWCRAYGWRIPTRCRTRRRP